MPAAQRPSPAKEFCNQKAGKSPKPFPHNDRNIRKSAQRFFPNRNESTVQKLPGLLIAQKAESYRAHSVDRTDRNRQRHAARRALGGRHFDRPDRSAPQIVGQHFDPSAGMRSHRHAERVGPVPEIEILDVA